MLQFFEGRPVEPQSSFEPYWSVLYELKTAPNRNEGPWTDTPADRQAVATLLSDVRIENGFRLVVVNLDPKSDGLLAQLALARSQVEQLLRRIPAE